MNLPTFDAMYAFLKERYKAERFHLRDGTAWCPDYSKVVARSALEQLAQTGVGYISHYESVTGKVVKYNAQLEVIE